MTEDPITTAEVLAYARRALVELDDIDQFTYDTMDVLAHHGATPELPASDLRDLALKSEETDDRYVTWLDTVVALAESLRANPAPKKDTRYPWYMDVRV